MEGQKEKAGEPFNSSAYLVKKTNQSATGTQSDTTHCTKTKKPNRTTS